MLDEEFALALLKKAYATVAEYGVPSDAKSWLVAVIRRRLPNARIIAFGSRIKGGAKQYADLDLAIDAGGNPIPAGVFFDLQELMAESDLPFKVDLGDYAEFGLEFREHIRSHAQEW